MGRVYTRIKLVEPAKNLANTPELITQYCQQVGQPKREGKATVRNIPDNNLLDNKILATMGPTGQDKKWQQFPLIEETAAKKTGVKKETEKSSIFKFCFYSLAAGCTANCQAPAGRTPSLAACLCMPAASQPASQQGAVHPPRQDRTLPLDGEITKLGNQKRQFPQAQR
ncbi:hypothetical protein DSO57_1018962 [Entomophthora muscae]|uniref:Uncharacterized protein n=1 Tax=Entomophthora muscae TaxID=34485 RepID=A0ACC2TEU9_9FUNG|nr:hypothetical protein DSO57_1018962 [Entomophthora muscae]